MFRIQPFFWRLVRKRKVFLRRLLRIRPSKTVGLYDPLSLGTFGIVSVEPGLLSQNQREAIRKVLSRRLKSINGSYWVNIDHYIPLTKKAKGARMGKGRGAFFTDKAPIRPGYTLCEFSGLEEQAARKLHASLSKKLPIRTKIIFDALA